MKNRTPQGFFSQRSTGRKRESASWCNLTAQIDERAQRWLERENSEPYVDVVVLTLTRIIKSVVTGQAPVTLNLRNTPVKNTKPSVVHA